MARPTDAPKRWAYDGGADKVDAAAAFAEIGFIDNDPARNDWLNWSQYTYGEWLTYLSADLNPADGVLDFREWRCPDDSAYTVEWDGPSGTDGLLTATLTNLQVSTVTQALITAGSPTAEAEILLSTSGAGFAQINSRGDLLAEGGIATTGTKRFRVSPSQTVVSLEAFNAPGWRCAVQVNEPGGPGAASVLVDADTGNVTLSSDYGDVETDGDHHADGYAYRSPLPSFSFIAKPGFGVLFNGSGTVTLAGSYGAVTFSTSAATIAGRVSLPQIPGSLASGTVTTLTAVTVHYSALGGATPATCIFRILTLSTSSTPSTLMERQVSTGSPPAAGTIDLVGGTVTSAIVPVGQPLMLEMESVTAGTDVQVSAVVFTFTRTHVD